MTISLRPHTEACEPLRIIALYSALACRRMVCGENPCFFHKGVLNVKKYTIACFRYSEYRKRSHVWLQKNYYRCALYVSVVNICTKRACTKTDTQD